MASAARQLGRAPKSLLGGPVCPEAMVGVWHWFLELHGARGAAAFGANPLGWTEIDAWARLTGIRPTRFELDCLLALDRRWRSMK